MWCWHTSDACVQAKIDAQGEAVRGLKASKADAAAIKAAVDQLLALKTEYKSATGEDYPPPAPKKESKPKQAQQQEPTRDGPSKKEVGLIFHIVVSS